MRSSIVTGYTNKVFFKKIVHVLFSYELLGHHMYVHILDDCSSGTMKIDKKKIKAPPYNLLSGVRRHINADNDSLTQNSACWAKIDRYIRRCAAQIMIQEKLFLR